MLLLLLSCLSLLLFWASAAQAGGGPENVIVVVNEDSWASKTVANHYVSLRKIPPHNVVYLHGLSDLDSVPMEGFRQQILKPVLSAIEARHLQRQIDYIVYSSDLPHSIDLMSEYGKADLTRFMPPQAVKVATHTASINGLTFLYGLSLVGDARFMAPGVNWYARRYNPAARPPIDEDDIPEPNLPPALDATLPLAFRSYYAFDPTGARVPPSSPTTQHGAAGTAPSSGPAQQGAAALPSHHEGMHYVLSTMLAVTSGRGASVRQAIDNLTRSAAADGTRPGGTIYFMRNSDIRTKCRQWGFEAAIAKLHELNVRAEILDGDLPKQKKDVAGLMAGVAVFDWSKSQSEILPGAICEHLTSCGGMMAESGGQTQLTKFIQAGAAGASGTVCEPYAVQAKFPTPFIHYYYAAGCSLGEAFYQSVSWPYQLLIVGDPLCQPWAKIPAVALDGIGDGNVTGMLQFRPRVDSNAAEAIAADELFLDGRLAGIFPPGAAGEFSTAPLSDGYHELRLVAIAAGPIATQGRAIAHLHVNNAGHQLVVWPPPGKVIPCDQPLVLHAAMPGAAAISFYSNGRLLGRIDGPDGNAVIDPAPLGFGPVAITALASLAGADGNEPPVAAEPLELEIIPPMPLDAVRPPAGGALAKGLGVTLQNGARAAVEDPVSRWLFEAGVKPKEIFAVEGYFTVPADDLYQFQIKTNASLVMQVDDKPMNLSQDPGWKCLPVSLAKGLHVLRLRGHCDARPELDIRFGGEGALNVIHQFEHVPAPDEKHVVLTSKKTPPPATTTSQATQPQK